MKTFHMVADALFMAENIDDAFLVLGKHFISLYESEEPVGSQFMAGSKVDIHPEPSSPPVKPHPPEGRIVTEGFE